MKIEVSADEQKLIEQYRNLFPEFQRAASVNIDTLFKLQSDIVRDATAGKGSFGKE